ncbi:hypothetical protein [Arthrobacter sp. H-02-3]|uniref:hypothetical protein n=1 Tax=Arthrobacter sp. H-02-3 TaxID=2703675 RepID=UPI00192A4D91|nr:hypothetical protein [Arthrobacter sp. H-02-3]
MEVAGVQRASSKSIVEATLSRRPGVISVLRSRQYVNVTVTGNQPQLRYLDVEQAIVHCTKGTGILPGDQP